MISAFLLLACGEAENPFIHLADVANPTLVVNAGDVPPAGQRIQVLVHPELSGVCRELPDLTANVDGVALKRLHGKYDDGTYSYDRDCNVYEFVGDAAALAKVPAGPQNVVTVTDGITTISLTAAGLFAKPALVAPPEPVAAGSLVTLPWVAGGDVVNPAIVVGVRLTPQGEGQVQTVKEVKATSASIAFSVPEGISGTWMADIFGTSAFAPPVSNCVGAVHCEASRAFLLDPLPIVVK